MVVRLSEADHANVSHAIAAAEATSDGEILAVVTEQSDPYHDVALHWAVAVLVAVLAWFAVFPGQLRWWFTTLFGVWQPEPTLGELLTLLMIFAVLKFTVSLLILRWRPLRMALTPATTKQRRVRRRAIALFKAAAEARTAQRTGVMIYLSVAERKAEIIADEAIHKVTDETVWGEAMAHLLDKVAAGQPGEGLTLAVGEVGAVLSKHFPKTSTDVNEIPDKLIEL